ncbi:MAG: four helix bundle protein [Microgenomates group bacterium]|jgi:four helix bundle protein
MIKDVTDLEVYKESMYLLHEVNTLTSLISQTEKDLISQIKRASRSIPANLAEGFAKKSSTKEFKRYLMISLGSSDELITHFRVLIIINPGLQSQSEDILKKYQILSKRLNVLYHKW